MKKENFDISSVPKDGYLIFPLSMSRLSNVQSGKELYEFLKFFEKKISKISLDVIFLYTNDLYLNSDDRAIEVRKTSLNKMTNHKAEFLNILLKEKKYVPQAFHFLPWDYVILNSENFLKFKDTMLRKLESDTTFKKNLLQDLEEINRDKTEANIGFLIEEIIVTHLLLQQDIILPHTLTSADGWRLVCYPGKPINSLRYTNKHNLLPKRSDLQKQQLLFSHSFYDMKDRVIIDLDKT